MTPQERAAYRAFVREHHPDRGGDPAAFVEGLARLRGSSAPDPDGLPPVGSDPHHVRVEVVADLAFPVRVAIALIRTARRHRRTRVDRPAQHHHHVPAHDRPPADAHPQAAPEHPRSAT